MNKIPTVILIGRQNVGKSTLFNSLIKNKKAIVDSTPGVTRDSVYGDIKLDNKKIRIIDTGGISDENNELNKSVQKKREEAEFLADIILFIVEAGNFIPEDIEFSKKIRKLNKKVFVIVNKCDTPEKDDFINDFYKLGFKEVIPVSASQNRNINFISEKIIEEFSNSETIKTENEDNNYIKISILGKPNVGKSSLLNKITGKNRSIVSKMPGTTRDIIDEEVLIEDQKFLILDTAGIRRKTKVNENVEYYSVNRAIKSIEMSDIVYLVIDSTEEISTQDKKIAGQIINKGKGIIVVLNKWDLANKSNAKIKDKTEMLLFKFPQIDYVPIVPVSSLTGEGIKKLLTATISIFTELQKTVDTSDKIDYFRIY